VGRIRPTLRRGVGRIRPTLRRGVGRIRPTLRRGVGRIRPTLRRGVGRIRPSSPQGAASSDAPQCLPKRLDPPDQLQQVGRMCPYPAKRRRETQGGRRIPPLCLSCPCLLLLFLYGQHAPAGKV
jgi:hypothetical protein